MGLFRRLLQLHRGSVPLEDFCTEVVAHLFERSPEMLVQWLRSAEILPLSDSAHASISTQRTFTALEEHHSDSRMDMFIEVADGDAFDVVAVEAKIGAQEGVDQLKRYADHLAALTGVRKRVLVYLTRDYDPKNASTLTAVKSGVVHFIQLRWHHLSRFLISQPSDPLLDEALIFLKEHGMTQSHQFTAVDLLALAEIPKVFSMMNETLFGHTQARFRQVVGGVNNKKSASFMELNRHQRYILYSGFGAPEWWCGLGYYLGFNDAMNYPSVRLMVEVGPNCPARKPILAMLREIAEEPGWRGYRLDQPVWSGVVHERGLHEILAEEDHLHAVTAFFEASLTALKDIQQRYPHIPWRGSKAQQGRDLEADEVE